MAKNLESFCFKIEDRPGTFTAIAEILGQNGVNIDGCAALRGNGTGYVCILANKPQEAESALKNADVKYEKRKLFELNVQDKPGELAKITRAFADANINISVIFITMRKTVALSVDNESKASKILEKLQSA